MVTCATHSTSYVLSTNVSFCRRRDKFLGKHPELRPRFARILTLLARNPFTPTLELHRLQYTSGLYAASLTYSYRVLVRLEGRTSIFVSIGTHEALYRQ